MRLLVVALLIFSVVSAASTTQKFHHWFPKYSDLFRELSQTECARELNNYWTDNRTECVTVCACAADCLLSNSPETVKSNMASATILLGFTPSILALLGPTVAEMSLLSARFPVLAILLALASPAVSLMHLFRGGESSESVLGTSTSVLVRSLHGWLKQQSARTNLAIRIAELVIVGAMLANNIHTSITLDLRTVSGFRCGQMYMPLVWSLLSIAVHLLGFVAIRLRGSLLYMPISTRESHAISEPRSSLLRRRTMSSFFESDSWKTLVRGKDGSLGEVLFWSASLAGIVHMVFGVIVLSSLLFVAAMDALPVLIRYTVSACVCQAVLLVELAAMRLDL
jgi:hypothetical protein